MKSVPRRSFGSSNHFSFLATCVVLSTLAACGEDTTRATADQAQVALRQGNPQLAMSMLRDDLQRHPNDSATRLKLANLLLESGDPDGASIEFKKAAQAGASAESTAPGLARAMVEKQQYSQVLDIYGGTKLSDGSAQAELTTWVATAHLRLGQRDKAQATVESALTYKPAHPLASALAARLSANTGDLDRAFKFLDVAAAEPGADERPELWMSRADLQLYGKRDADAAQKSYTKVIQYQPTNALAHSNLIQILLIKKDTPAVTVALKSMAKALPKHPQTIFATAAVSAYQRDFPRARDLLQALMRAGVTNVEVIALSGAVELELGNVVSAVAQLQRAVYQTPNAASPRKALARAQLKAGAPEKALEVLEPLLRSRPVDRDVLSLAANAHLTAGRVAKAELLYSQALAMAPDDAGTKTQLALAKMRSNPDEALALLQSTADSSKDTVADMALIAAQLQRKNYDAAVASIEKLGAKDPTSTQPVLLLGQVAMMKRDFSTARRQFDKALAQDQRQIPALLALVSLDRIEGKYEAAENRLKEFLKQEPRGTAASLALAELQMRRSAPPTVIVKTLTEAVSSSPLDAAARKALITFHLKRNDAKANLDAAQAANAAIPGDLAILSMLGNAQMMTGDVNQALATFQKLISQAPSNPKGYVQLAQAEAIAGRAGKAEASYRKALEIDPDNLEANRGLVALGLKERRPELALRAAKAVQKDRPNDALGHILEGDILLRLGKNGDALAAYRAGLERKIPLALPSRVYALLKLTQGNSQAQSFSDDWLKKQPNDASFRFFLGSAAMQDGNWTLAEKHFSEAARLVPNSPAALNNLAWLRIRLGKPGAVALAEKALTQSPEAPALLDTLALAQAAEGSAEKAIETARLAISKSPEVAGYHVTLAQVLIKAGNKSAAASALSDAEKLKPDSATAKEIANLRKQLN